MARRWRLLIGMTSLLIAVALVATVVAQRLLPPRGGLSKAQAIAAAIPDRRTFQAASTPTKAELGHCDRLAEATSGQFTSSGPIVGKACDARWAWRVDWDCASNHPPARVHIFVDYRSGEILFVQGFECGHHGPCCSGRDVSGSQPEASLYGRLIEPTGPDDY